MAHVLESLPIPPIPRSLPKQVDLWKNFEVSWTRDVKHRQMLWHGSGKGWWRSINRSADVAWVHVLGD